MTETKKAKLVELVKEIQATSACVTDFDALMNRLEEKLGNPHIGKLIFDPPSGKKLSAEEIVDLALSQGGNGGETWEEQS